MYIEKRTNVEIPLFTLGVITWIVFLILKLCNAGNPNFAWLTWFWVWFPLWIPVAVYFAVLLCVLAVYGIISLIVYLKIK